MSNYHLQWTAVRAKSTVEIVVTPEDGIAVSGHVRIVTVGAPDDVRELARADLVPSWKHTMAAGQSIDMTLRFVYHTQATSKVAVAGKARNPDQSIHPADYNEAYDGSDEDVTHVYVWVN